MRVITGERTRDYLGCCDDFVQFVRITPITAAVEDERERAWKEWQEQRVERPMDGKELFLAGYDAHAARQKESR